LIHDPILPLCRPTTYAPARSRPTPTHSIHATGRNWRRQTITALRFGNVALPGLSCSVVHHSAAFLARFVAASPCPLCLRGEILLSAAPQRGQKQAKMFSDSFATFFRNARPKNSREEGLKKGSGNLGAARVACPREALNCARPIKAYFMANCNHNL
jgi:hypothetical protein